MSDPSAPQPGPSEPAHRPLPVAALAYVIPDPSGRPTVITAVGVVSIVMAAIGGFYGLMTTLQAVGFYMVSAIGPSVAAAQSAAARAELQTAQARAAAAAGAPAAGQRQATVRRVAELQPLSPARRRQLDAILASSAADMGLASVTESGTMPHLRSDEAPPTYFVTPAGRLELFNDRAVFYPHAGETVRASAPPEPPAEASALGDEAPAAATAPATQPLAGGLTAAEVESVVRQAQSAGPDALSVAQLSGLRSALSSPKQQLVPAGASQAAVKSAHTDASGWATVVFSRGASVSLDGQGNVKSVAIPAMAFPGISRLALGLMLATSLALMALAAYLLVCGILTLRQSPRGRRLHLVYAWLKIPAEIAAAAAAAWVMRQMVFGVAPGAGATAPAVSFVLVSAVIPAALGCAYPVALLVVMNRRRVREYYNAVATTPDAVTSA